MPIQDSSSEISPHREVLLMSRKDFWKKSRILYLLSMLSSRRAHTSKISTHNLLRVLPLAVISLPRCRYMYDDLRCSGLFIQNKNAHSRAWAKACTHACISALLQPIESSLVGIPYGGGSKANCSERKGVGRRTELVIQRCCRRLGRWVVVVEVRRREAC